MAAWITLLPVVLVTVLVASMFNYGICDDTGIVFYCITNLLFNLVHV